VLTGDLIALGVSCRVKKLPVLGVPDCSAGRLTVARFATDLWPLAKLMRVTLFGKLVPCSPHRRLQSVRKRVLWSRHKSVPKV